MKYNLLLALSSMILITACSKDTSKTCTYYKKPLPVDLSFVGYYDYQISNFDVYQYEKNTNFTQLIKKDEVRNDELIVIEGDTSNTLFMLGNKADYMVVLTQLYDTFYISNINYEPEYFEVVESSGKCDQQKEYFQIPSEALVNEEIIQFERLVEKESTLYLTKPE